MDVCTYFNGKNAIYFQLFCIETLKIVNKFAKNPLGKSFYE